MLMKIILETEIDTDHLYEPIKNILDQTMRLRDTELKDEADMMLDDLLESNLNNVNNTFNTLCTYMVYQFSYFDRSLGRTNDSLLQQHLTELTRLYAGVLQTSRKETLEAVISYCDQEMAATMIKDNRRVLHQWTLIRLNLNSLS